MLHHLSLFPILRSHPATIAGYLDSFEANESAKASEINPQKLFLESKRVVQKHPANEVGDLKKKHYVSVN